MNVKELELDKMRIELNNIIILLRRKQMIIKFKYLEDL
jgi:hypothetical protein